jgi:hypothetical protein
MYQRSTTIGAFVLFASGLMMVPAAGASVCGYPVQREYRPGYECWGKWVDRPTGRTVRCRKGERVQEIRSFCTQWQLTGGGTLFDPKNQNPKIINNPNQIDPRRTKDGRNARRPPPAPPLR